MLKKHLESTIERIVIIVAMHNEAKPIIDEMKMEPVTVSGLAMHRALVNGREVFLVQNSLHEKYNVDRIGTQAGVMSAVKMMERLSPDTIISVGTAGGLKDNQKVGDIVLSSDEFNYVDRDVNLGYGIGHFPCLDAKVASSVFDVKLGKVVSSNSLDLPLETRIALNKLNADAIDMEASAIAEVVEQYPGKKMLALKVVSNMLDKNLHSDFEKNLPIVCATLAKTTAAFIPFILGKKPSQLNFDVSRLAPESIHKIARKYLSSEKESHQKLKNELDLILAADDKDSDTKKKLLLKAIYTSQTPDLQLVVSNIIDAISAFAKASVKRTEYSRLTIETIPAYLQSVPSLQIFHDPDDLVITSIGDGNLNYVFSIKNKAGKRMILKQAPPFLKIAGEGSPLSTDRMKYEIAYYRRMQKLMQGKQSVLPKFYYSDDEVMMTLMMEDLRPRKVLRKALIQGEYPAFSFELARYLASALFYTSHLYLDSAKYDELVKFFNENTLKNLTSDFVFTFPYMQHASNYSNKEKFSTEFKMNARHLRDIFLTSKEALIHGDLHTGSIMASAKHTLKVIDPEFAMMGPIGFDLGLFIANIVTAIVADSVAPCSAEYQPWLFGVIKDFIGIFRSDFKKNWRLHEEQNPSPYFNKEEFEKYQNKYLDNAIRQAYGFAGLEICRRMCGIAGVAEIRDMENKENKAKAEGLALQIGQYLVESFKNEKFNLKDLRRNLQQFNLGVTLIPAENYSFKHFKAVEKPSEMAAPSNSSQSTI